MEIEYSLLEAPALSSKGQRRSSRIQAKSSLRRDSIDASTANTTAARSSRSPPAIQSSESTPTQRCVRNTPQENTEKAVQDIAPSKRSGLRHKRGVPKDHAGDLVDAAMKPLTDEERRSWPGWVELVSEPTLFNYILREYGVKDVKVQEVFSLDDEALNFLPKPVYGLVFLFRYWDEDNEEVEELPKCPNYVWFANQTITNACATVAMMNIVMNVPNIDLGESLSTFKAETRGLKPSYRGQRLGENGFIRNIHNSFARRMDMLNADLALSNDVEEWDKINDAKRRKGNAWKSQAKTLKTIKVKKKKKDEEEPGFHFIAYVPINGDVWKLDGLQRQPVNLGEAGKDWIELARENINIRIAQRDAELQFNVMSLCRSPLQSIPEQLADNLQSQSAVEKTLNLTLPDWKSFVEMDQDQSPLALQPNDSFALSKELLINSYVSDSVQQKLQSVIDDPMMLMDMRRGLVTEQIQLQRSYIDEVAQIGMENEQAAKRKVDYTSIIYKSIKVLAEQGVLKGIVKDLVVDRQMKA